MSTPMDSEGGRAGRLMGPVVVLRVVCGVLLVLAVVLAATAESSAVALTAFGVTGFVPFAVGMVVRTCGRWGRSIDVQCERDEDAAIVMPLAALCWQPVVLASGLRDQIFHISPVTVSAGVAGVVLAIYLCSR